MINITNLICNLYICLLICLFEICLFAYSCSANEVIQDYPAFRRAILDQRVDSHALLTRLPLARATRKILGLEQLVISQMQTWS